MKEKFDFEAALKAIQSGQSISGKDGVLAPLVKQLTEAALEAELDSHLADDVVPNRRNGKSRKTLKTSAMPLARKPPAAACVEKRGPMNHASASSDARPLK